MHAAIEKLKKATDGSDTEAIKSATSELEQAAQAFSKVLYEKAGAGSGGSTSAAPGSAATSPDDDAIDAEFEVKD